MCGDDGTSWGVGAVGRHAWGGIRSSAPDGRADVQKQGDGLRHHAAALRARGGRRRTPGSDFSGTAVLRKNGYAAFLADHNTSRSEALFLPFLGEEAAVNKGPAVLAVRAKALVWPLVLIRDGDRYRMLMEEPLDTALLEGTADEKALMAATYYTEAIERMVRRAPDQWFWMHNRWKTKRVMDD